MNGQANTNKILFGIKPITNYLGISKNKFYELLKHGMPAAFFCGQWTAHTENLDGYFRAVTLKIIKGEIPEEQENDENQY